MRFTLKFKIGALLIAALALSLLSYGYVGTTLIVADKTSYIYDFSLSRASQTATILSEWLARVQLPGGLIDPKVLKAASPTTFAETELTPELSAAGITPDRFKPGQLLLVPDLSREGEFWIGQTVTAPEEGFLVARARLPRERLEEASTQGMQMVMINSITGVAQELPGSDSEVLGATGVDSFAKEFMSSKNTGRAREWIYRDTPFIVAQEKIRDTDWTVAGVIPQSVAFAAVKALVLRTALLGIGIICLSIGLSMLLLKGIVAKLQGLWKGTEKVAQGDFTVRVPVKAKAGDEVDDLARSFNKMSEEIEKLLIATAEKARMEKELVTAQVVQSRFFPAEQLNDPRFELKGKMMPASECGGDWWFYASHEDTLVVVVGDVTGHGVSAALVTAAVHSVFSNWVRKFKSEAASQMRLETLISALNSAVYDAAGHQSTMTLVASAIDLSTGVLSLVNASHRTPYLFTLPKDKPDFNPIQCIKPMSEGKCEALGQEKPLEFTAATYQLKPGDFVFWYTDGVLECKSPEGKVIGKAQLARMLADCYTQGKMKAEGVCDTYVGELEKFFGKTALEDDVTVVVGIVPPNVEFKKEAA